jgi:endonuclease-8
MPEGDTIHKTATRLRPALEGRPVVDVQVPRWAGSLPVSGERIEAVRAVGKHLLVDFSGGLTLRTHLRMSGRWDLYRTDERWRRSPTAARVVIEVPGWTAVCFSAPDVALTRTDRAAIDHLGPDLCDPTPDLTTVVSRARASGDSATTIGELLLDQRVAAGIGNVFKSETLFLERLDPTCPASALPDDRLREVFQRAHLLMRANLGAGRRRTVPEGLAVYGRAGKPCRRCGARVVRIAQGRTLPRSTYWCPSCQARPEPAPLAD